MAEDIFGDPIARALRKSRKRQLADQEQRSVPERIQDCLSMPLLYEMAERLPAPESVGCPRKYPTVVYLMIAALMPVTKSKRSAVGALTDEVQWKSVRKHIRANLSRAMAARLPDQAPTRDQYQYAEAKLLAPAFEELEEEFRWRRIRTAWTACGKSSPRSVTVSVLVTRVSFRPWPLSRS